MSQDAASTSSNHDFTRPNQQPGPVSFRRSVIVQAHHPLHPPGLVLPDSSMQNQMHELAKTLPPPRKQNTACDACRYVQSSLDHTDVSTLFTSRTRKVKCQRIPSQEKVDRSILSSPLHVLTASFYFLSARYFSPEYPPDSANVRNASHSIASQRTIHARQSILVLYLTPARSQPFFISQALCTTSY
jgi:hypothetical protein